MSQTDRQTDKASHWKSAIFDVDDNWSRLDAVPPEFVKRIHKQQEICPTTQKPHFQIHVECNRQVRLTQMCSWIKATKWIPVLGKQHIENSINYTAKKESAVAGTHQVIEGQEYLQIHQLFREIARYADSECLTLVNNKQLSVNSWASITSRLILSRGVEWISKLSNPTLRRLWDDWGWIVINEWVSWNTESSGAFIIEGTASEETPEGYMIEVED